MGGGDGGEPLEEVLREAFADLLALLGRAVVVVVEGEVVVVAGGVLGDLVRGVLARRRRVLGRRRVLLEAVEELAADVVQFQLGMGWRWRTIRLSRMSSLYGATSCSRSACCICVRTVFTLL